MQNIFMTMLTMDLMQHLTRSIGGRRPSKLICVVLANCCSIMKIFGIFRCVAAHFTVVMQCLLNSALKRSRDEYVKRLNAIYASNLEKVTN
jgi:hypothetical protein